MVKLLSSDNKMVSLLNRYWELIWINIIPGYFTQKRRNQKRNLLNDHGDNNWSTWWLIQCWKLTELNTSSSKNRRICYCFLLLDIIVTNNLADTWITIYPMQSTFIWERYTNDWYHNGMVRIQAPVVRKPISANPRLNRPNRGNKFILRLNCVPQSSISTIQGIN